MRASNILEIAITGLDEAFELMLIRYVDLYDPSLFNDEERM